MPKQTTNTWKIKTLKKASKHITYLDMKNFYSWTMSSWLSYDGFKCLKNVDGFYVNWIRDLEYPDELHVLHNDYPLAPEKLAIPYDML